MRRYEALEWMKAIGITLIVYDHVAHATTVAWVPPIYVKQFGVAFFLFATGFTLARERRAPLEAVVSRLLPVYVFGLATAAAITAAGLFFGSGLEPSNYLPFMAGANVVFNNFPANPTTWYLGTYIHMLLLWAVVFTRCQPGMRTMALVLAIEVPARIALQAWAGPYVAYMLFTNWLGVFVAGVFLGARPADESRRPPALYLGALAVMLTANALAVGAVHPIPAFPFMVVGEGPLALLTFSLLVSMLYLSATLLLFKATEHAAAPAPVRFLARNSLFIVLLHMPLFLALNPPLRERGWSYGARVVLELVLCLPVLAWFSEAVTAVVAPKIMAARLTEILSTGVRPRAGRPAPSAEFR